MKNIITIQHTQSIQLKDEYSEGSAKNRANIAYKYEFIDISSII